jgi:hypothetical protein
MQSRIYLGGFMQNQSPVITQIPFQNPVVYGRRVVTEWIPVQSKPVDTKIGAIPANFFFSL